MLSNLHNYAYQSPCQMNIHISFRFCFLIKNFQCDYGGGLGRCLGGWGPGRGLPRSPGIHPASAPRFGVLHPKPWPHWGSGRRAAAEAGVTLGKAPAPREPQFPSTSTCLSSPPPLERPPPEMSLSLLRAPPHPKWAPTAWPQRRRDPVRVSREATSQGQSRAPLGESCSHTHSPPRPGDSPQARAPGAPGHRALSALSGNPLAQPRSPPSRNERNRASPSPDFH